MSNQSVNTQSTISSTLFNRIENEWRQMREPPAPTVKSAATAERKD